MLDFLQHIDSWIDPEYHTYQAQYRRMMDEFRNENYRRVMGWGTMSSLAVYFRALREALPWVAGVLNSSFAQQLLKAGFGAALLYLGWIEVNN